MKKATILLAALGLVVGGCTQSTQSYSAEMSQEMRKPRPDGPDFGAFQRTSPAPGDKLPNAPKHIEKGKG